MRLSVKAHPTLKIGKSHHHIKHFLNQSWSHTGQPKGLSVIMSVTILGPGGVEISRKGLFVTEESLKDLILAYVRMEEQSIASLTRELEKDGYKFHRLMVTGYLRALKDVGLLKEKIIPPSKVYSTSSFVTKDIYELVGERCQKLSMSTNDQAKVACYIFQRLFHRAIFLQEIKRAGFKSIDAELASEEQARIAKSLLKKAGVKLPYKEPPYVVGESFPEEFEAIVTDVLLDNLGLVRLVASSKQETLNFDPLQRKLNLG